MPRYTGLTDAAIADAAAEHDRFRRPWKTLAWALGCSIRTLQRHCKRLNARDNPFCRDDAVAGRDSPGLDARAPSDTDPPGDQPHADPLNDARPGPP